MLLAEYAPNASAFQAVSPASGLPDAPEAASSQAPAAQSATSPAAPGVQPGVAGTISGTVVDTGQDVVQGARVTLTGSPGGEQRSAVTGSSGEFSFTGLPPRTYTITVTGPSMSTITSKPIV